MDVCPDYEDLFKIFNAHKVRYLVVGAHAVIFYTEPRYTKDIDVWVIPELNDPHEVYAAMREFGTPHPDLRPEDFTNRKLIVQIGLSPVRIDILMNISGVAFEAAWRNRRRTVYGRTPINVIGREELLQAKAAAGRPMDRIDIAKLKRWSLPRTPRRRPATRRQKAKHR